MGRVTILCFLLTLFVGVGFSGESAILRYQDPAEVSDDYLGSPVDMDFSTDGRLYIADSRNSRILVWNADGSFARGFGTKGQGPGEFVGVSRLRITGNEIYLFDQENKMSVFDLDGNYKRSFKYPRNMRTFAALNPNLLLIMYRELNSPTDIKITWELADGEGKTIRKLMSEPDTLFVGKLEGNNNAIVKAYAAEGEIQEAEGLWYFGYGSKPKLNRIDATGKLLDPIRFDLTASKPDDADIEIVESMSFPGPGGKRIGLKDLPGIRMQFDHNKDYYTQFMIRGDHVILAMSPLGGTGGLGVGFHNVRYVVCSLKTGNALHRGSYHYPEDSRVLFNKGHCLGLIVGEGDEFEVKNIELKGLPGVGR